MAYDYRNAANYLSDVLSGLSAGFLSAPRNGPPLAGLGIGLQNANQLMAQRQMQAQQDLRDQLLRSQLEQQQEADAEKKRQTSAARLFLLGQQVPTGTGAREPGAPVGSPGAISSLPANAQPFFKGYADIDPMGAAQMAGNLMLREPDKSAPTTRDFNEGGNVVTKQWNPATQSWDVQSTAPRWQPAQPPQMPGDYQIYLQERAPGQKYSDWKRSQNSQSQPGIVTLFDGKGGSRAFYQGDPGIKPLLDAGWTDKAPTEPKAPGIVTLYDQKGGTKAFYQGDPAIQGLLQQGWTDKPPVEQKSPGLISLTKDGQTVTINENDPQRGMYLGSGWVEASAAPKPGAPITLWDPSGQPHSFASNDPQVQQRMGEGWVNVAPKSPTDPSFITLVSPTGDSQTLKKGDQQVDKLLSQGWVERSGADPNSKPFTEDQSKTAQLLQELLPNAATGDPGDYQIAMQNFDALNVLRDQFAGKAPELVQSFFTSPEYQRAKNALKHIIANNLYNKSGAQITDTELERQANMLLPQPGESDGSVADKKARIPGLMEGMKTRAGRAAAEITIPTFGQNAGTGGGAVPVKKPAPPVGTIEDGHRFKGGDPADPNNWEVVP